MLRYLTAVLFASLTTMPLLAQQPSGDKPKQPHPYDIDPKAGPWAICVKSYAGPTSFQLSFDLVSELRRDYQLPAYFYNRGEEARAKENERLEAHRKIRWEGYKKAGLDAPERVYVKKVLHIEDQYAVLVGGYRDMEAARRGLDHLRTLKAPSDRLLDLGFSTGVGSDGNIGGRVKKTYLNPFLTAFVVPNPSIPQAKAPPTQEPTINLRELNSAESYSLFKCPGKWTLVVKSYQGASVIVSKDSEKSLMEKIGLGGKQGDLLEACAKQAHQLAEILRNKQLNLESYVLHTKNLSIVTVGSFENENDPRMYEMMSKLSKLRLEPYETLQSPTPFRVPK